MRVIEGGEEVNNINDFSHFGFQGLSSKRPQMSQQDLNARRALKFAQLGQYRKAAQSLTSNGLDDSEAAYAEMLAKHPDGKDERVPEGEVDTPQLQFSLRQVTDTIHSFRPGSAGGPSALKPEHLKEAIYCKATKASADFKASLLAFINFIARGASPWRLPLSLQVLLCLLVLRKMEEEDL